MISDFFFLKQCFCSLKFLSHICDAEPASELCTLGDLEFLLFKVWTFWKRHKIWKNLPLKIWCYWVTSNGRFFRILCPSQNIQTVITKSLNFLVLKVERQYWNRYKLFLFLSANVIPKYYYTVESRFKKARFEKERLLLQPIFLHKLFDLTEPRRALQPKGTQWFPRIGLFEVQAINLGPCRRPLEFLTSLQHCKHLSKIPNSQIIKVEKWKILSHFRPKDFSVISHEHKDKNEKWKLLCLNLPVWFRKWMMWEMMVWQC